MADRDPLQSGEHEHDTDAVSLPSPVRLRPGDRIEEYEIVRLVAAGQSALVYEARDLQLDRPAAIKVLLVGHPHQPDPRWIREGRALSRVNHPNVVGVYRAGTLPDGNLFIAMEYAPGQTLREWLNEGGRFALADLLPILIQIANGVAAAHRAGVIHRDLKPENVVCDEDGSVKVLDLGIARMLDTAQTTTAGLLVGTLAYLAPERIRGEPYDGRCDVYALGLMAYECLDGVHPMVTDGRWPAQHVFAARQLELVPPLLPGLPADFSALLFRCLSKQPEARPSMEELSQQLRGVRRRLEQERRAARSASAQAASRRENVVAVITGSLLGFLIAVLAATVSGKRTAPAGPESAASARPATGAAAVAPRPAASGASTPASAPLPVASAAPAPSAASTRPLARSTTLPATPAQHAGQVEGSRRARRAKRQRNAVTWDAGRPLPASGLGPDLPF